MTDSSLSIRAIRDDDDLDDLHDGDAEWFGAAFARKMTAAAAAEGAVLAFDVAEQYGRLLGYLDGFLPGEDNPTHAGFGGLWVRPDARGHGVGSALLDALLSTATQRGARRLTSRVDSEDHVSLCWLEARGGTTGGESTWKASSISATIFPCSRRLPESPSRPCTPTPRSASGRRHTTRMCVSWATLLTPRRTLHPFRIASTARSSPTRGSSASRRRMRAPSSV